MARVMWVPSKLVFGDRVVNKFNGGYVNVASPSPSHLVLDGLWHYHVLVRDDNKGFRYDLWYITGGRINIGVFDSICELFDPGRKCFSFAVSDLGHWISCVYISASSRYAGINTIGGREGLDGYFLEGVYDLLEACLDELLNDDVRLASFIVNVYPRLASLSVLLYKASDIWGVERGVIRSSMDKITSALVKKPSTLVWRGLFLPRYLLYGIGYLWRYGVLSLEGSLGERVRYFVQESARRSSGHSSFMVDSEVVGSVLGLEGVVMLSEYLEDKAVFTQREKERIIRSLEHMLTSGDRLYDVQRLRSGYRLFCPLYDARCITGFATNLHFFVSGYLGG